MSHVQLGAVPVPDPGDAAAVQIPSRDGFSDPPGHAARDAAVPPRRATPAALYREGAARFWLFRRYPERYPLRVEASWRLPVLFLGALRANGAPTPPR